jgi:hypothetical protein
VTRTLNRFCCYLLLAILLVVLGPAFAQEGEQKPAKTVEKATKEKGTAPEKSARKPELPFQIQLLESHIRLENNGDSRKEVHTIVKINNILGAHQLARLTFDYNRAFQQVEIPLVRISHANGGTSELLPSAVVDAPNPAVEKFPAYQDVRVKSVRILGLEEGDTIEYRVITTTAKHPLAPNFWLEHTFDRSGQVLEERYELDLPASRFEESEADKSARLKRQELVRMSPSTPPWQKDFSLIPPWVGTIYVSPQTPENGKEKVAEDGASDRLHYKWDVSHGYLDKQIASSSESADPDVVVTTYNAWQAVARTLDGLCHSQFWKKHSDEEILWSKGKEFVSAKDQGITLEEAIYYFVSQRIKTVDLPLELTGFMSRPPLDTLTSGYGTAADKAALFAGLIAETPSLPPEEVQCGLIPNPAGWQMFQLPRPSLFSKLILRIYMRSQWRYLDASLEVAPFGMMPSNLRGKDVFLFYSPPLNVPIQGPEEYYSWQKIPDELPFAAFQKVRVGASLGPDGTLSVKVKYTLRGDNELLLRVAFHQTAKEKWKDVAGLLAIADGFRGQVTSVNVSDPMATKDPFTVEYEITQAKFVDWSKKPVRIPALLPQIELPDPPAKQAAGEAARTIDLGTPLDVDTQMTLKLPAGTIAQVPAGTSVERDYAKFSSKYSIAANTVTASRRVNFLLREIAGDRAMDYSAFVRAVQSDQAQPITLVREAVAGEDAKTGKSPAKQ